MTTIDLAHYTLVRADHSRCPDCGHRPFLLSPRTGTSRPLFYLCLCGAIRKAGSAKPVAPSLQPMSVGKILTPPQGGVF